MSGVFLWGWDSVTKKWIKVLLDASGHLQLDVLSSALPAGAATEAKQDTTLTELQQKLETGDLAIEAGTKYLKTIVTNDPVISQTDPEQLKHTPHGYYAGGASYKPYAVDVDGRLRIVSANEDIGANVYHSADQTIANATYTYLAFDSERYDTDTIHDNTTNNSRLTCKTAGKYLIIGQVLFAFNATGSRIIGIVLNHLTTIGTFTIAPNATYTTRCLGATIYDLVVNDYVELIVFQTSGGNLDISAGALTAPQFKMQRIG